MSADRDDTAEPAPGALVIDLEPIRAFAEAVTALEAAWAEVPAGARKGLSQMLWLHPDGEIVAYRVPGEPVKEKGG